VNVYELLRQLSHIGNFCFWVPFLKQLLLRNCAMDFVEICNVYVEKMIIKAAKRIFNSDKICRSYRDLNFGITFFGTQCILYSYVSLYVICAFAASATSAWNGISDRTRSTPSLNAFRTQLQWRRYTREFHFEFRVSFWRWNGVGGQCFVFWGQELKNASGWPGWRNFWPRNELAPLLRWRRHCSS